MLGFPTCPSFRFRYPMGSSSIPLGEAFGLTVLPDGLVLLFVLPEGLLPVFVLPVVPMLFPDVPWLSALLVLDPDDPPVPLTDLAPDVEPTAVLPDAPPEAPAEAPPAPPSLPPPAPPPRPCASANALERAHAVANAIV